MAWGMNGTPVTLTGTADDMDITDLEARKFNQFLLFLPDTTNQEDNITFDDNGNTDYAQRKSVDGGTDSTATSQNFISDIGIGTTSRAAFKVIYGVNIDSEEKLFISFSIRAQAGASNAPSRSELVSKVDTTTNTGQYTRIDVNNTRAGNYQVGANLSVLGTD